MSTNSVGSTWRWLRNLPWAEFATTANATRFRYRDQLWPLVVLGFLAIARLMADGANTPGVALLCLFVSAAVVFYLRRKLDRAKEWMYAGCCLGGASLGLILISLVGTDNRTLNAVSIIGGFGLALIWWCHHEVRGWPGHSSSTLVNRWNAHILESKGDLGGATLGPPTPFAHGNKHKLQLIPGRQTLPMFQANILKIESGLRTPLKDLILEKDPDTDDPTMLELTHITKSPIKNTIWFDKPRCVDGMINVGPYADGIGEAFFRIYTENSMHSGFILGGTGAGKALDVATPIPTPTGWTTMGALKAGDKVFDDQGHICNVVHAFDVLNDRPCYDVSFSDGAIITADADHLWWTEDRSARRSRFRTRDGLGVKARKPILNSRQCAALRSLAESYPTISIRHLSLATGLDWRSSFLRNTAASVGATSMRPTGALLYPAKEVVDRLISDGSVRLYNDQRYKCSPGGHARTTKEIRETLHTVAGHANHSIPVAKQLMLNDVDLPIPPYVLGYWLGDGASAGGYITTADPEVICFIRREGYTVGAPWAGRKGCAVTCSVLGLRTDLRSLGLISPHRMASKKRIPDVYLRSSAPQRRALLAGLLDSDGTVSPQGGVNFDSTNHVLADQVRELALSLGYRATIIMKDATLNGRVIGPAWRVNFTTTDQVFWIPRKRETLTARTSHSNLEKTGHRYITAVTPVESRPVRCIEVDSPTNLFLAGRNMIPTHNSRALDQLAISVLSMRNTIVFYIDGQNGASSPTLWKYADWAVGTDGFFKMMAALELGARWRQRENSAKGWDGSEPSEERPGILVILDEMHRITPLAPDRLAMAVCEWRKLLMAIWGADQDSGLDSTFAGKDRMRSAMLTGNSSVMHVKSRIAGNLIPGLAINPADLPKIPGYAVLVADEGVEDPNGDPVRTAPYRNRYAPSRREKDKAEAKGVKVPVRTLEEWYELYPNPKMDRGTALAMGTNYLRRHETAAAAQADLLRDIESIADIDDDTLDRALAELSPSSETKMAEASEQRSTEGDSGDSAVTGEQIMALDWAGPKTRAQILEELEGRNGVKPNTSTVTYALSKLKAAQRLDQPSRGVYAIKGSG